VVRGQEKQVKYIFQKRMLRPCEEGYPEVVLDILGFLVMTKFTGTLPQSYQLHSPKRVSFTTPAKYAIKVAVPR